MPDFLDGVLLLDFTAQQIFFTILVFIWSGFVRSGLGFGGAALGLPFMLLIYDQPLFWLPVIGIHLLLFTGLTLRTRINNVDWDYLKKSSVYIFPAKLVGVFGLISLPNQLLIIIIYSVTLFYAVLWLFNWHIHSEKGWTDKVLLAIGGYISGTSLTGAPLIVAVFMQHVTKDKLRNTLFVLWFVLVIIKLSTLAMLGINLNAMSALLLVPVAAIGHVTGLKAHETILQNDQFFKRFLGAGLIIICLLGFMSLFK